MNELQEFFSSVAKEKEKVAKEKQRFEPQVNVSLSDLSNFFGTIKEEIGEKDDNQKAKILSEFFNGISKFENALEDKINSKKFKENSWEDEVKYDVESRTPVTENIAASIKEDVLISPVEQPTEQVDIKPVSYFQINKRKEPKLESKDTSSLAQTMSEFIRKPDEIIVEKVSALEQLKLEFRNFKENIMRQLGTIGGVGGGEVNILNMVDIDTSALGDGKFLVYNATTKKLEFTNQVDGN